MKRPVLEVIRFDEADIIIASGMGMGFTAKNFGNEIPNDGIFSFFGGSSGDVNHDAHDTDIVSAFNSYFGGKWEDLNGIIFNYAGGFNNVDFLVYNDTDDYGDTSGNSKYNGTYSYENGEFSWRSN